VTLIVDLDSGIRVLFDVKYLCANLCLPSPLCSRVRIDVRDRQTSNVRQKHRLMPPLKGRGIKMELINQCILKVRLNHRRPPVLNVALDGVFR